MRALLALLLAASAHARPKEADALEGGCVYVVPLPGVSAGDVDGWVKAANEIYEGLGVKVRARKLAHPRTFEPMKTPEKSSFVVIGGLEAVKKYVKTADPEDAIFAEGWGGAADGEPERSQNKYAWLGKHKGGGRLIMMDLAGVELYRSMGPKEDKEKKLKAWTRAQAGALILVHGSGHNADLDAQLQHYERGIMIEGTELQHSLSQREKSFAEFTSPARNQKLIAHLKTRY